jgi:hypothetical protein
MESDIGARLVSVRSAEREEIRGSGLLLTENYVLTCANLIGNGATAVVARPGGPPVPADVVWRGDPGGPEVALLRTARETDPDPAREPLRWARLADDTPVRRCEVLGAPVHGRSGGPAPGRQGGTLWPAPDHRPATLWLDQSPGTLFPDRGPGRGGLMGAPVHLDGLFLGLVTRIRDTDSRQQLLVVTAGTVLAAVAHWAGDAPVPGLLPPRTERLSGSHPEDTAFERRYAAALKARYRRTEIFGIDDLGISEAAWDLDTAYLSLEATSLGESGTPPEAGDGTAPGFPLHLLNKTGSGRWTWVNEPRTPARLRWQSGRGSRVEDLLGESRRTLLRGDAGAGKTTLVWWLASHTANGTLPAELEALNGLVPFVVPLRGLQTRGERFPGPDDLARIAELPIGGAPAGWADRVLESGRGLLLVDGLDELPPNHPQKADRAKARAWLTALLERYPENRCLVTARPGAVEAGWMAPAGFADLLLLPMSDDDIDAFVTAWHNAARLEYRTLADPTRAEAESRRLTELESTLRREFRHNTVLRDLARTPLLCAVICVLHRKREGDLPRTRWELYHATLELLLGKRDRRRGIDAPEGLTIGIEEHKVLLQTVAVWLVRNNRARLTTDQAHTLIAKAAGGMPQVRRLSSGTGKATDEQILIHLLNRSGLLRLRGEDSVEFIHRTFQDYLAAKEFAETDSMAELLGRAGNEQWQDVVRLSVGHFDRGRVSRLVEELGRLGEEAQRGRDLLLLAGECAASAVYLDPGTRERTEDRVRTLMPPLATHQARELARLGGFVLPLLPPPSGHPAHDSFVIETIARIGGPEALALLGPFTENAGPSLRGTLLGVWDRFPAGEYAREVLSRVPLHDLPVVVRTGDQLSALRHCGPLRRVVLRGDFPAERLDRELPPDLERLTIDGNRSLTGLGFLTARPSITDLQLVDCPALTSLDELAGRGFDALRAPRRLLAATTNPPTTALLGVRENHGTGELDLGQWAGTPELSIHLPADHGLGDAVAAAARLPGCTRLRISPVDRVGRIAATAPGITTLHLIGDLLLEPDSLGPAFPSLRNLVLEISPVREKRPFDLTPLRTVEGLRIEVRRRSEWGFPLVGTEYFTDRLTVVQSW